MSKKNLRKKSMAFGIIVLFLGAGVVSGINGNEPFDAVFDQKQQQIGINSATKVANMKLSQLGKTDDFSVGSLIELYRSNENIILFYVFNLQPQGYIVVSADSNLPPVIAYSFTDNFQSDVSKDNILLQMLKADVGLRLENVEKLPENIIESRNLLWREFLNEETEVLVNVDFQQWPPEGTTQTEGWIETKWHQNSPYNDFCPIDLVNGGRSIAGCPAVAMAQILNYHETINNVVFTDDDDYIHNWDNRFKIDDDYEEYDFPSFPELNNYLDTLVYHYVNEISITDNDRASLTFACGVAAQQLYSNSVYGSGTLGVNQAYKAYLRFAFDNIELLDEDDSDLYERLISDMMNALPAHLAIVNDAWTVGHNLVVDGYNTDGYYHLNFGGGGSYDGWYLFPDDLPLELTVIEGVIVNILPDIDSDLKGNGAFLWNDIEPGSTITDSFTIENVGDPGSAIDWEIIVWPEWGTWTFTPMNGEDLTPENEPFTVEVTALAPDKRNDDFSGHIKIVNVEDSNDFCLIHISLSTSRIKTINPLLLQFLENFIQRFPLLEYLLDLQ